MIVDREYTLLPMDREKYAEIPGGKKEQQGRRRGTGTCTGTSRRRCWLILVLGLTLGLQTPTSTSQVGFREQFTSRCEAFTAKLQTPTSTSQVGFREQFTSRCEAFTAKQKPKRIECEQVWSAFESAYVGNDPCNVLMEAYDPLISVTPFEPACNKMMFWSKTKDVVHELTENKDCYVTLEDSLLGSVLDGLTWCGEEGSSDTLTSGCPGWTECYNNPVRSFWNRASAGFAEAACGDVTSMLNGSIATPFDANSIFGSIEVQKFNATRVTSLNIVLVNQESLIVTDCNNPSLRDLQKELDPGLKYKCKEVAEANITACATDPETPCGACW